MDNELEKARKRRYAKNRPDYARWYTKPRWRKLRATMLAQYPKCRQCGRPSSEVDHIIAHKGHYGLFYGKDNLQTLCKSCHSRKTAKECGFAKELSDKQLSQCDDAGFPVDPDHPWNR